MFADKVLEKLYNKKEVINTHEKVDYLLILMWGNNVTITEDFVYYCKELMNGNQYDYLCKCIEKNKVKLRLKNQEQISYFFSMMVGLGFYLGKELREQIKSSLTSEHYHIFHIGMDLYYRLVNDKFALNEVVKLNPKSRIKWFRTTIDNVLKKEKNKKKEYDLIRFKADKERNQQRLELKEAKHRREIRERNARRAKHVDLDKPGHSIRVSQIILTNMGGKR